MRSISELVGKDDVDSTPDRECYRCDRTVAAPRLFQVTIEPPEVLSDQYRNSVRFCCPDCVAAMGMLEFTERWVKRARRG